MARLRIVALCAVVAIVVAMMPAAATTSLAATGVGDPLPDVESLTTPFSRVVRNADGTFTASLSAGPARVRQPDGSWAEIDLHLERTEHGFSPRVGWTPVTVFADSSEGVGSIGTPSGRVVVGVEGSASVDGTMVPGEDIDVVQFSGALGTGTEIEAHATTNGLKTSYTVPDANAASVIERVTYPAGWSARQGGGYVALYDAQGQHVASWAGGTATDSTGLTAPVRMDLIDADGGMARASAAVDEAWLARAAYPVTIDPLVFVVAYAGNDSWLNSQFPTNTIGTYKGWTEMHVGRRDAASAIGRAFLIYDIARYIPANATVVSADLRLYEFASLNNACYYSTINVRRASTPWDDQTNWLTQPGRRRDESGS